jgi:hypothetical protein
VGDLCLRWVMLNTLVDFANEYMGSQWAVFIPSVVKGPLRTLANNASHA